MRYLSYDIEYVDDALPLGLTTTHVESFLHALETEGAAYAMRLYSTKTVPLANDAMPAQDICFPNGEAVPTTTQAKYPRCALAKEA